MSKKKTFINKQEAATLRLVYRPQEHVLTTKKNENFPVFQVVPKKLRNKEKEEDVLNLADIITKKLNEGDYTTGEYKKQPKQKKAPKESDQSSAYPALPDHLAKKLTGRSDLWINQLDKMKKQKEQEEEDDEDYEDDDGNEDWEDGEDGDVVEDGEDGEDWEDVDDNGKVEQKKIQIKDVKPEIPEIEKDIIDFKKVTFHPSIQQRRFDENGLPLNDGYDYSQHIYQQGQDQESETVSEYFVKPKDMPLFTIDMDYQPEEMTEDQKQVYESLLYDGQDPIYEELEDNFVQLANEGETCIIETPKEPIKAQKVQEKTSKVTEKKVVKKEVKEKEMKISYKKHKVEEEDEDDDYEDDGSDLDIDSEDEREFQKQMQAYDREANDNTNKVIGGQQLNKVLDDHILAMKRKKGGKPDPNQEELNDERLEKEEQREYELYQLRQKDYLLYLKEKYPDTDPKEFHLPKDVAKLTFEEDIAAQTYLNAVLNKEVSSEDEDVPRNFQQPTEPRYVETITAVQLEQSTLSKMNPEQLNIIKWIATGKTKTKIIKTKQEKLDAQKEYDDQRAKEHEVQVEKLLTLTRSQNETAEAKKDRKKLIKELKVEKKDKKKAFKDTIKHMNRDLQSVSNQNREMQNINGVSVLQVQ